jgi:DNA invertase Pin-like site-specific DNA recombinase
MRKVRCAIYTRKSSEEGLEQDFNSLDAQREACAAYILSQASEGWSLNAEDYDDGGLSGGSLDRPALQRLLGDIAAGKIDIIVVYKVDRLTRSLLDFAKLVEAFDKAATSFVSVTQSFNTTTSMGRLTLNMLLSFAQFEREVTAERIRDKIAASKARGMWMGGTPPLGYEPNGRSLSIVEEHAAIVRDIYRRYLALGNVSLVAEELAHDGVRAPERISGVGRKFGGGLFSKGNLYAILKNPIYIGQIHHRGQSYAGQHGAIVDREVWDTVQERLKVNLRGERRARAASASPLAGIVFDEAGEPLIPVHACKGKIRYRYYVSRALQHGGTSDLRKGIRVPAAELEGHVAEVIARALDDPTTVATMLNVANPEIQSLAVSCAGVASELRERAHRLPDLVSQVRVLPERLEVDGSAPGLADALQVAPSEYPPRIPLAAAVRLKRHGHVIRLVQPDGRSPALRRPQTSVINLLARASCWWRQLAQGQFDISELARREGVTASYVTRVVRLAFLSPSVTNAILQGRQRPDVTSAGLMITKSFAALWSVQTESLL